MFNSYFCLLVQAGEPFSSSASTRMMLDVRKNFETKYQNNMTCPVCHSHTDTQQELINCSALNKSKNTVRYSDLFSKDLSTVASALNKYQTMWKTREHILMNK